MKEKNTIYYLGIIITILSLIDLQYDIPFISILLFTIGFGMVLNNYGR